MSNFSTILLIYLHYIVNILTIKLLSYKQKVLWSTGASKLLVFPIVDDAVSSPQRTAI